MVSCCRDVKKKILKMSRWQSGAFSRATLDTGTLLEETWQAFRTQQIQFDLVILDHTYGKDQVGSDHLSANEVVEHACRLRTNGALKPNGRVFATHIAHEGNPPHPELAAVAKQHGYEVAYDGLILII